jgi:hypothetical protein
MLAESAAFGNRFILITEDADKAFLQEFKI